VGVVVSSGAQDAKSNVQAITPGKKKFFNLLIVIKL
jgi:hypothetical protein